MSIQTPDGLTVAVWMISYNHEKFIAEAIEGVMMQKTNFSYKLFIGEDCSTDQTRAICIKYREKYPDKIELFLNEHNLGASANSYNIFLHCLTSGAKYIALCEGDDYWTDSIKLQMQVDFLEKNPEISICGHVSSIVYEGIEYENIKSENYRPQQIYINKPLGFDDIIQMITEKGPTFHTSSFMFHSSKLELPHFSKELPVGDYMILMLLTKIGKAYVLPSNCSVHRINKGGITTVYKKNKIITNKNKIFFFSTMAKYLNENQNPMIRKKIIEGYKSLSEIFFRERQWSNFLKNLISFCYYDKKIFCCFIIKKMLTIPRNNLYKQTLKY